MKEKAEYTDEQLRTVADKWRNKRCPACEEKIGKYKFSGIFFPNHHFCTKAIESTEHYIKLLPPLAPSNGLATPLRFDLIQVALASICSNCGYISLWNAHELDMLAMFEHAEKDFGIFPSYSKKEIAYALNADPTPYRKAMWGKVLEWMNSWEKDDEQ